MFLCVYVNMPSRDAKRISYYGLKKKMENHIIIVVVEFMIEFTINSEALNSES